eukprot:gene7164-7922_t
MTAFEPLPIVIPPEGVVDIKDKAKPVCQTPGPYPPLAYTRGFYDISAWKAKLKEIFDTPVWHEHDHHSPTTVKMARAAHDAWGVHKIIFIFCDDFLQKVVELPNYQKSEWRELILPIFHQMGVDENRVVRCLLARMPSGVSIPVHHDTGYWVKYTHRCHVALETSELVDFMVGPNENNMVKMSFEEGRIVELNNQSKHSVINRLPEGQYRTHIIFDYLDESYPFPLPKRLAIPNGETIFQTRRSFDTGSEVKNYVVQDTQPKYIIIGAQRCATVSLNEYLHQHPLLAKAKIDETHYFDWRFNNNLAEDDVEGHRNCYMQFYEKALLQKHPSISTGESTPSYLLHSDVVLPRLKRYVPWVKLIVMLRNPVDRAYSQYQMVSDIEGSPEQLALRGHSEYRGRSFSEVIGSEIKEVEEAGITAESSYEEFREKLLSKRKEIKHGGHSVIIRGLYALQLSAYLSEWPKDQLKILCMESDLKGSAEHVQETMDGVFGYLGLPPSEVTDTAAKNSRSYDKMNVEDRERLESFYRPFNEKLFKVLGREFPWH